MVINKKCLSLLMVAFFLTKISLFAQLSLQSQQVLLPKKVYIGDQAELRCSFTTKADLNDLLESENLSTDWFVDGLDYEDYELKDIKLLQSGPGTYLLVIHFIPWKIGSVKLPSYMLKEDENLLLKFEDINISSLTDGGTVGLQNLMSPLLLPGTSYKLYGLLFVTVLFLFILIRLIIKREAVALAISNRKLIKKYKRNKKLLLKSLTKLMKLETSDVEFCQIVQQLLRTYLEIRFDHPFTKTVSSNIYSAFEKATSGLLADDKYDSMEQIQSVFIRTDFIRYAQNNNFNEKAVLEDGERAKLIDQIIQCVNVLEKTESKDSKKEDKDA